MPGTAAGSRPPTCRSLPEIRNNVPNSLTPAEVARIRDARPAGPAPQPASEPVRVDRRVSSRGAIVVARQRIHVGIIHGGRTITVEPTDHTFRVTAGEELLTEVARTATKPIARFKVRKPEPPRIPRRSFANGVAGDGGRR
jgi:hypothetical protein